MSISSGDSEFESGAMPRPRSSRPPHGSQIIFEEPIRLLAPEELIIWEILYQTIVDCYMVAIGRASHFFCMEWHDHKKNPIAGPERILRTARDSVEGWVESDAFADYVHLFGYNPTRAVTILKQVLSGEHLPQIRKLIEQINKQRDFRRDRKENFND